MYHIADHFKYSNMYIVLDIDKLYYCLAVAFYFKERKKFT